MPLFQNSVLNKYLKSIATDTAVQNAYTQYKAYFHNAERQENIRNSKEEQFQEGFLRELFVKILGYTINPEPNFNLTTELKNVKGSKKVDGAILKENAPVAVIELKGTDTTDLGKVENQAFGYKNNHVGVQYIITSNFEKLRFYIDNAIDFEEFNLFNLSTERFSLLWLLLEKDNLLKGLASQMKGESLIQEEQITKQLYKDYSTFRKELFNSIAALNPQYDKLFLFKKTQKLLDRFLFIFFAEDRLLLPPNSTRQIMQQWSDLREKYDEYFPLYDRFKKYFGYLDKGHKGKQHDIFAYNGGLFAPDEVLDNIRIDDLVLYTHTQKLSDYDFQSDVDVNILGHIFENSLNEIEELAAEIENQNLDKSQTKRKKDGVFYTPKYITKYIVDNTVGKLCHEKKTELAINEEEYTNDKKKIKATKKTLLDKLETYRKWLLDMTICDPACGSGAFLNQALDFLITEHRYIDELQAKLLGASLVLSDIENSILERNLYGVDINEESVEIAKLSLWLRTARPDRKLTSLNNNIKCGNSLIDDPEIAGDKAFNWANEFPEVFGNGGFDVVIGNPPYVLCQPSNTSEQLLNELKKYKVASYKIDLFHLFFEKAISTTKSNGYIGFITPNTYLTNMYIKPLRKYILDNTNIVKLVCHEEAVFPDASVDVATIILCKSQTKENIIDIYNNKNSTFYKVLTKEQVEWQRDDNNIFNIKLTFKLNTTNFVQLGEICNSYFGIQAYDRKSSISDLKIDAHFIEIIDGGDIHPYSYAIPTKYFNYRTENIKSGGDWKVYSQERIVIRQIGLTPIVGMCKASILASNTLYSIYPIDSQYKLKYILCILNSTLIKKYWLSKYSDGKKLFPKIKGFQLKELPIAIATHEIQSTFEQKANIQINFSKKLIELDSFFISFVKNKFPKLESSLSNWRENDFTYITNDLKKSKIQLSISQQAEWMQYFNEQKEKAQALQAEIDRTDKEIDKMVYELYGLTAEEIAIVEGAL